MFRCLLRAIAAAMRPKNVANCRCIKDAHRRFWILACRWFVGWQSSVLIVKPETVLRWHREGWRTYWRWRSRRTRRPGRRPIPLELRTLIRCMAADNRLWGQRRIQAELSRLGFKVSARTVAKYMQPIKSECLDHVFIFNDRHL